VNGNFARSLKTTLPSMISRQKAAQQSREESPLKIGPKDEKAAKKEAEKV
jgi:hypothetical protein